MKYPLATNESWNRIPFPSTGTAGLIHRQRATCRKRSPAKRRFPRIMETRREPRSTRNGIGEWCHLDHRKRLSEPIVLSDRRRSLEARFQGTAEIHRFRQRQASWQVMSIPIAYRAEIAPHCTVKQDRDHFPRTNIRSGDASRASTIQTGNESGKRNFPLKEAPDSRKRAKRIRQGASRTPFRIKHASRQNDHLDSVPPSMGLFK